MLGISGIKFAGKTVGLNNKTYANKSENEINFGEKYALKKDTVSFSGRSDSFGRMSSEERDEIYKTNKPYYFSYYIDKVEDPIVKQILNKFAGGEYPIAPDDFKRQEFEWDMRDAERADNKVSIGFAEWDFLQAFKNNIIDRIGSKNYEEAIKRASQKVDARMGNYSSYPSDLTSTNSVRLDDDLDTLSRQTKDGFGDDEYDKRDNIYESFRDKKINTSNNTKNTSSDSLGCMSSEERDEIYETNKPYYFSYYRDKVEDPIVKQILNKFAGGEYPIAPDDFKRQEFEWDMRDAERADNKVSIGFAEWDFLQAFKNNIIDRIGSKNYEEAIKRASQKVDARMGNYSSYPSDLTSTNSVRLDDDLDTLSRQTKDGFGDDEYDKTKNTSNENSTEKDPAKEFADSVDIDSI